jgi:hypothetical protein
MPGQHLDRVHILQSPCCGSGPACPLAVVDASSKLQWEGGRQLASRRQASLSITHTHPIGPITMKLVVGHSTVLKLQILNRTTAAAPVP